MKQELSDELSSSEAFDNILGIATFDPTGLPIGCLTTEDNPGMSWVQTVFQALSLRSMLAGNWTLGTFHTVTIRGEHQSIFVVKENLSYFAFLVSLTQTNALNDFLHWLEKESIEELKLHPRFQRS